MMIAVLQLDSVQTLMRLSTGCLLQLITCVLEACACTMYAYYQTEMYLSLANSEA